MNWITYSIIGALLSSAWSLSVKQGVNLIYPTDFSSTYTIISLVLICIINSIRHTSFSLNKSGLIAGIFKGISAILLTKSFTITPNPGLTIGTFRIQSIFTAIVAFWVFGSQLSMGNILAMCVVIIGLFVIATSNSDGDTEFTQPRISTSAQQTNTGNNKTEKFTTSPNLRHTAKLIPNKPRKKWLVYALLAGLFMSIADIFTKQAVSQGNPGIYNLLFNITLASTVLIVVYDRITTGTFKIHNHDQNNLIDWKDYLIIIWTGIIVTGYTLTTITAINHAPNVGYAKAIDTLGVIITLLGSHVMFRSKLSKEAVSGILLVLSGILYISFSNNGSLIKVTSSN